MNTERLYYIGRRMDGDKMYHGYVPTAAMNRQIDPKMADLGARYYAKPLGIASVGNIVEITSTDDGKSVWTSGEHRPRLVSGDLPSDVVAAAWMAADRAAYLMSAQIKTDRRLAREADQNDPLHRALDVIRDAHRAQRGIAARAAFIRYVEEYLHS